MSTPTVSSPTTPLSPLEPGSRLSDFARADLDDIVDQLTVDEAISLIAGVGFWWTAAVPRLGVPSIKVRTYLMRSLKVLVLTDRLGLRWYESSAATHVDRC